MPHLLAAARPVAAGAAVADRRLLVHSDRGVGHRGEGARVSPAQVDVERDGEEVVLLVDGDEAVEVGRLWFFWVCVGGWGGWGGSAGGESFLARFSVSFSFSMPNIP